ncbi:MAG: tetratricopeptide repeat protein [Deltaproteobacteria bacterium]|nr:tetratricopeptide repeat protein [Deltaproteobacteria bacterium]
MKHVNALLIAGMLAVSTVAYAQAPNYNEAQRLIDSGAYSAAEDMARKLVTAEPRNDKYHQLLGDVYRKEGRYDEAMAEYSKAKELGGENAELLKSIGSIQKKQRNNKAAAESYKKALKLDPKDREAADDLASLERSRGVTLRAVIGGVEPDYTTDSYEASLSYGGVDKLELNAGYGYSDNVFYTRDKFFASAYYFYKPDSYFKVYAAHKNYDYPVDPVVAAPNPDTNSYDTVPVFEAEISHWITRNFRGSFAYEYFRPTFFYDQDSTASNHKFTTEAYYITPNPAIRLKAMFAILRDPDSQSTEIKGRDNVNTTLGEAASTDVHYKTTSLLGAGIEYSKDKWSAELKYLPNRDLDDSYDYSILTGVAYDFTERFTGRFDYVYDKYAPESNYSGETANVYLVSGLYSLTPSMDIGAGFKHLKLPASDDNAAFLTLSYRTGLGF